MPAKALIFSPIPMGYGSPQYLYMYDLLKQAGYSPILVERHDPKRSFQRLPSYTRFILRPGKWHRLILWLKILFMVLFEDLKVIVAGYDLLLPLPKIIQRKAKIVRYYLELKDDSSSNIQEDSIDEGKFIQLSKRRHNASQLNSYDFINLIRSPRKLYLTFRNHVMGFCKYDALIAPEEQRLALAKSIYPDVEQTFLVYNSPPLGIISMPRKLGKQKPIVLYQGQINLTSCSDILFETISKTYQKFDYLIAGPVSDPGDKSKLDEYSELGWVKYFGWLRRDELASLQIQSHIGLVLWGSLNLNTRFACPNKLYEYIAAGIPVICTPNESLLRWNQKYHFGLVMRDWSSSSLEEALLAMSSSPALYSSISTQNIDLYQREFNWNKQTGPLLNYLARFL